MRWARVLTLLAVILAGVGTWTASASATTEYCLNKQGDFTQCPTTGRSEPTTPKTTVPPATTVPTTPPTTTAPPTTKPAPTTTTVAPTTTVKPHTSPLISHAPTHPSSAARLTSSDGISSGLPTTTILVVLECAAVLTAAGLVLRRRHHSQTAEPR